MKKLTDLLRNITVRPASKIQSYPQLDDVYRLPDSSAVLSAASQPYKLTGHKAANEIAANAAQRLWCGAQHF